MSSVHAEKAQCPIHKIYVVTSNFTLLDDEGNTSNVSVVTGNRLIDMGKRVYLASGTLIKVQLIPRPSAGGTEANMYKTGYICIGDGSMAGSAVVVAN